MRSNKINYLAVGLFIIISTVGLVTSLAVLMGRTGSVDRYYAMYSNVTGVKFGSQVVYEGYPIGQVDSVRPQENNGRMEFRVDFSIVEDWRIPADSVVEIAAPSLLAAVVLNIHAGSSPNAIKPDGIVPSKELGSVFGAVTSLAEQLAVVIEQDVKPLLQNVDIAIQGVNSLVGGEASVLMKDISRRIPRIADNIEEFTTTMNETSKSIHKTSMEVGKLVRPKNRILVEEIIGNINTSTVRLNSSLVSMKKVLVDIDLLVADPKGDVKAITSEARFIVETVSRHIDAINENMDATARNMSEFSRQIRANPGMLLSGTPPKDRGRN